MKPFEFIAPDDIGQAVRLVAERRDARFHAGGTNLVDLMKLGVETPGLLVDVNGLLDAGLEESPTAHCGSAARCATATSHVTR